MARRRPAQKSAAAAAPAPEETRRGVGGEAGVRCAPEPGSSLKTEACRWRRNHAALAALVLMAVVSYFPATQAGFVWDDEGYSPPPSRCGSASGLARIWFSPTAVPSEGHYWPLVYTTFWLEHKLWGFAPAGYHLVNLLLHLVNTLLLWRILLRLPVPGAWLVAAVFAVHPLHVETVAWVIERKDLLAALFYLAAFSAYMRFSAAPRRRPYLAALGLYAAGLLCKSIVVTLPAALLILAWWLRGRVTREDLLRLLPFFLAGAGIVFADWLYYSAREPYSFDYSLPERALIAARALWFYAGKLLWPAGLAVIYPHWDLSGALAWSWLAAAAAAAALLHFARRRTGRGPAAGVLFFAVTLSPVLGFVDYGYMQFSFVADRFQYLAGIGVMAVVVGAAVHWAGGLPPPARRGLGCPGPGDARPPRGADLAPGRHLPRRGHLLPPYHRAQPAGAGRPRQPRQRLAPAGAPGRVPRRQPGGNRQSPGRRQGAHQRRSGLPQAQALRRGGGPTWSAP